MHSPTLLSKLQNLLNFVLESPYSGFYKDFYKRLYFEVDRKFPASLKDWRKTPFLTKYDLMAVPMHDRLFVPLKDVALVRTSSGTSGKGILFSPRNFKTTSLEFINQYTNVKRLLNFWQFGHIPRLLAGETDFQIIPANPSDLEMTARHAKHFNADGIVFVQPTLLVAFIPHLKKYDTLERIRGIFLYGDLVTNIQLRLIKESFPNATVVSVYASTDAQGRVSISCAESVKHEHVNQHHILPFFLGEIIGSHDAVLENEGDEGELVLTTLETDFVLPLIRYRTGDRVRPVKKKCLCGSVAPLIEFLGRISVDTVTLPFGEIRLDEAERVMEKLSYDTMPYFELHYYEKEDKPYIELYFDHPNTVAIQTIERIFPREFRITPTMTYAEAVEKNLCLPLVCALLKKEKQSTDSLRKRGIVKHV